VILSTHILSDIETIAKKEIRLEGGRVVREYADANM
jgi:ABC-type multidrug transport system ATPase subunit